MVDIVCTGELLIDFVPTQSGTDLITAPGFVKAPGGAPANVAVGLARLGTSSAFMGMVGDDPFGRFLAQTLETDGVDTGPLRFNEAARTALAFVSLGADGEREFMFYRHPSADMMFAPADVDEQALADASCLHFGSVSLIAESSRDATLYAVERASASGCLISYDPNLRLPLWPDPDLARERMLEGLAQAHVVKVSDDELEFLTGSRDVETGASELWREPLRLLLVTFGADGCAYVTRQSSGLAPGNAVRAVDTTGAGDAFVAALLDAYVRNPDLPDHKPALHAACVRANAAGAITTLTRGAIPALPTRAELDEWMRANGLMPC